MTREEVKVLAVDDSKTMLRVLQNALTQYCGVPADNIALAEHGEEGLQKVESFAPHLILSDWNMPIMSGIDFIAKVREKDTKVTIIMLTTEGERSKVIQALKAGANDYVVKPFTPDIISKKLSAALDMVARRYA